MGRSWQRYSVRTPPLDEKLIAPFIWDWIGITTHVCATPALGRVQADAALSSSTSCHGSIGRRPDPTQISRRLFWNNLTGRDYYSRGGKRARRKGRKQ